MMLRSGMARPDGATSNKVFETLADWNAFLEQREAQADLVEPASSPKPRP